MNHISTLMVTQQYIQNQVQRLTKQNSEDILQVITSALAAIDERFKLNEAAIKSVTSDLDSKDKVIGNQNLRH